MNDRKRSATNSQEDSHRPRGRPKRKKRRSLLPVILLLVFLVLLAGAGLGAYFLFWSGKGDLQEASDRLLGTWEGPVPNFPARTLRLEISPSQIQFTVTDAQTGSGGTQLLPWEAVRASGNTLVIHTKRSTGHVFEWSFQFETDDRVRFKSLGSDVPEQVLHRVGRRVPRKERNEALAKSASRLFGKWNVPTLYNTKIHHAVYDFGADGSAKFTLTSGKGETKTVTGTWSPVEERDGALIIQVRGIEGYNQVLVRFLSDNQIRHALLQPGMGSVEIPASRVP